jgi:prephenate dehydrogenase
VNPVSVNPARLKRVTVIGLGLMGGSLALALRRTGAAEHIVGCGRAELLRRATEMGAIDSGCVDAGESVVGSDLIFLCAPVETSIALLAQIAPRLAPGALISDVGSTKKAFATAAREIFGASAAQRVLPGHPLAGGEVSGLEHASGELFAGCLWVLTPIAGAAEKNSILSHQRLVAALEGLGARVIFSTPEEHDRTLAYTSHLPQMLSSALALTLEQAFSMGDPAVQVHGGGLRTMLRLAESNPAMWEQIAASNRDNLAEAMQSMEAELRSFRESLGSPEFRKKFEQARKFARLLRN